MTCSSTRFYREGEDLEVAQEDKFETAHAEWDEDGLFLTIYGHENEFGGLNQIVLDKRTVNMILTITSKLRL